MSVGIGRQREELKEEIKVNLEVLSRLSKVILVLSLASWPYFADVGVEWCDCEARHPTAELFDFHSHKEGP